MLDENALKQAFLHQIKVNYPVQAVAEGPESAGHSLSAAQTPVQKRNGTMT